VRGYCALISVFARCLYAGETFLTLVVNHAIAQLGLYALSLPSKVLDVTAVT
jgi:hypothetical protein